MPVLGAKPSRAACTPTGSAPSPRSVPAVLEPYAAVGPYSKCAVAARPAGVAVPVSSAAVEVMPVAGPVAAPGGRGGWSGMTSTASTHPRSAPSAVTQSLTYSHRTSCAPGGSSHERCSQPVSPSILATTAPSTRKSSSSKSHSDDTRQRKRTVAGPSTVVRTQLLSSSAIVPLAASSPPAAPASPSPNQGRAPPLSQAIAPASSASPSEIPQGTKVALTARSIVEEHPVGVRRTRQIPAPGVEAPAVVRERLEGHLPALGGRDRAGEVAQHAARPEAPRAAG